MSLLGDVWDAVTSVADTAVSAIHVVPGVDLVGEQIKDFAGTAVGKIVLTGFTSGAYQATEASLAPLTMLAPQLAAITFAIPGVLQAEPFDQAWVAEFTQRVKHTAEAAGGPAASELGAEIGPAIDRVVNDPSIQAMIAQGKDIQEIANSMGVRADVAQSAVDLVKRKGSSFAKDAIGDIPAIPGLVFDALSGKRITSVKGFANLQASVISTASVQAGRSVQNLSASRMSTATAQSAARVQQLSSQSMPIASVAIFQHPDAIPIISPSVSKIERRQAYFAKYLRLAKGTL